MSGWKKQLTAKLRSPTHSPLSLTHLLNHSFTHSLTYSPSTYIESLTLLSPTYLLNDLLATNQPTYPYLTHLLCLTYRQVLYAVAAILMFARFTSVMKLTSRVGLLYATQGG